MDISLILTTSRRAEILAPTLEGLCRLDTRGLIWEILVVDNADDAPTRAVAEAFRLHLPVRLLVEPRRGQNIARNRAIPEARGQLVVFTDDDVTAEPDWLHEVWEGVGRWHEARLFGGRVLPCWPDDGAPARDHRFFTHAYAIADWDEPEGPYSPHRVFSPNMAFRGSIFADGWRFDPRIGPDGTETYMTGSETSLTLSLERAGFAPIYLPRATVHHRIRPEQLCPAWLYQRAFRMGRWQAYRRGISRRSAPLSYELLCRLGETYRRFVAAADGDADGERLTAGLEYGETRGIIYQWRQGW